MQLTVCFVPEQTRIVIGEASGSNTLAKAKKMRSQSMDRANQVEAMGPEKKKADRREEIGDEAEG